ncbi:hypothetical protein HDZ31DRAFT_61772 [Schizophyllum fasciatum]
MGGDDGLSLAAFTCGDEVGRANASINGPLLVAVNIACLLHGCYLVQLYHYFDRYSDRDKWLLYLVITVTIICGLGTWFAVASEYMVLVDNAGSLAIWKSTPWQMVVPQFTNALSAFLVQLFYVSRIALFRRDIVGKTLVAMIATIAVVALAGSLANTISYTMSGFNTLDFATRLPLAVRRLYRHRERSYSRGTRQIIKRLIFQSVETGTVTAIVVVVLVVLYETLGSGNALYIVCYLSIGQLYGNVLLFTLNSRRSSGHGEVHSNTSDIELGTLRFFATSTDVEPPGREVSAVTKAQYRFRAVG